MKLMCYFRIGHDSANVERVYNNAHHNLFVDLNVPAILDEMYDIFVIDGKFQLRPRFWEGQALPLVRGVWFVKIVGQLSPFGADEPELAQTLESEFLKYFRSQTSQTRPSSSTRPVFKVATSSKGLRVRAYSAAEVFAYDFSRRSGWRRVINARPKPTRLIRGYNAPAVIGEGYQAVKDLVFVLPGVGQRYFGPTIVNDTQSLRQIAKEIARKYSPEKKHGVAFVPVQWSAGLDLDMELLSSMSPDGVNFIRQIANEVIMDTVVYVLGNVRDQVTILLNETYQKYLLRDPEFPERGGRVSMVCHSLGSVIGADVIAKCITVANKNGNGQDAELNFRVRHVFAIGSPLGIYLYSRHRKNYAAWKHLLSMTTLHNVFYALDPVAYRIEPYVSVAYKNIRGLKVHSCQDSRLGYERKVPTTAPKEDGKDGKQSYKEAHGTPAWADRAAASKASTSLPYRIDYELVSPRCTTFTAVLLAHSDYWTSNDFVNYVLQTLEEDI